MTDTKLNHPKIIHITTSVLDHAQVTSMMNQTRERIAKVLGRPIRCDFDVNVVCKSSGTDMKNRLGFSYVWCTNPEVSNILCGLNPDGSARVKKVTEVVKAAPKPESTSWADMCDEDELDKPIKSKSWADVVDEEEAEADRVVTKLVPLPPLFELTSWPITKEQERFLLDKYPDDVKDGSVIIKVIPSEIKNLATVKEGETGYGCVHNVLYSHSVIAKGTNVDHIRQKFIQFASDPTNGITKKSPDGKILRSNYPIVKIVNVTSKQGSSLRCFITFDPTTHDAEFALLMRRQTWVDGQQLIFISPWRSVYEQFGK